MRTNLIHFNHPIDTQSVHISLLRHRYSYYRLSMSYVPISRHDRQVCAVQQREINVAKCTSGLRKPWTKWKAYEHKLTGRSTISAGN